MGTYLGEFLPETSTGNKAYTGLGFTPKLIIFWHAGYSGTFPGSGNTQNFVRALGATTGVGEEFWCAATSRDNVSTTEWSMTAVSDCIYLTSDTAVATLHARAQLVSFDSDGFTLNWLSAPSTPTQRVGYFALGGPQVANCQAGLTTFSTGTSATESYNVTPGFTADVAMFAGTLATSTGFTTGQDCAFMWGAADGTDEWGGAVGGADGITMSAQNATERQHSNGATFYFFDFGMNLQDLTIPFASFDADGWNWDQSSNGPSSAYQFGYILIEMATYSNRGAQVGSVTAPSLTGAATNETLLDWSRTGPVGPRYPDSFLGFTMELTSANAANVNAGNSWFAYADGERSYSKNPGGGVLRTSSATCLDGVLNTSCRWYIDEAVFDMRNHETTPQSTGTFQLAATSPMSSTTLEVDYNADLDSDGTSSYIHTIGFCANPIVLDADDTTDWVIVEKRGLYPKFDRSTLSGFYQGWVGSSWEVNIGDSHKGPNNAPPVIVGSYLYLAGYHTFSQDDAYDNPFKWFRACVYRCPVTSDPTTNTNWECAISAQYDMYDKDSHKYGCGSVSTVVNGTDIEIMWASVGDKSETAAGGYSWLTYDTTTDTLTLNTNPGTEAANETGGQGNPVFRSDGDMVWLYCGHDGTGYGQGMYARRESGSWTVDVPVFDTDDDFGSLSSVLGASDRVHFCGHEDGATGLINVRTLDSDNTLNTIQTFGPINGTVGDAANNAMSNSILLGNGEIGVAVLDSNSDIIFISWNDVANPSKQTEATIEPTLDPLIRFQQEFNEVVVISLCKDPDNDDLYCLWTDDTSGDVYYNVSTDDGATWNAGGTLFYSSGGTAVYHISANVYLRNGSYYLGAFMVDYILSDGFSVYEELFLRTPGAAEPDEGMTTLGCGGGE